VRTFESCDKSAVSNRFFVDGPAALLSSFARRLERIGVGAGRQKDWRPKPADPGTGESTVEEAT
jgi:hypothetical protein